MHKYLTLSLLFLLAFSQNDARKANEAYEQGDYERAAELYREALRTDPEDPRLHFNLGNSLARIGALEEAIQSYERFKELGSNPRDLALADYNIGHLMAQVEEFETAAEHFQEALRKNPGDDEARHNYELAMRRQQEQEEQEQQSQGQDDQEQQDNQQQDEQPDQDQQPGDSDGDSGNQPPPQDQQRDPGQQSQESLTPEEAGNILNALEQRERDLLRGRKKESSQDSPRHEQDW